MKWVSDGLEGAAALAFRLVSIYKLCGWNGNHERCIEDNMTSRLDVYFDPGKQPLSWEKDVPAVNLNISNTSALFIHNAANPLVRSFNGTEDHFYYPFKDEQTEEKIRWQHLSTWSMAKKVPSYIRVLSYDCEMFCDLSIVIVGIKCDNHDSI